MKYDVSDFQKDVLDRSHDVPVLVDFWAEWCGPCKILGPTLERLAEENHGDWVLAKVDTERNQNVAMQYNIRSIPNVKLFVDGKVTEEFAGALPEPMLKQWLAKNIPSKNRKVVEHAEALLVAERTRDAQALLEQVLQSEPSNHRARVLLAQSLIFDNTKRAVELVEGIEEDSDQFELVEAVRVAASLFEKLGKPESLPDGPGRKQYADAIGHLKERDLAKALEGFIRVIKEDRYYDDDGSRKACIAIFKMLGEGHETTIAYRRDFSSALY